MNAQQERHGLGDPRIPWVVLLDLTWSAPPSEGELTTALRALATEAGWSAPSPGAVTSGQRRALLDEVSLASSDVLRLGRHDDGVVLAARHDALDGLAMLTAARRLLGDVRSTARGRSAGAADRGAVVGALLRRASEVLVRPPARVAASRNVQANGDVFALVDVAATVRTADLVHAGVRAITGWNRDHGRSPKRISVAIGASTLGGAVDDLSDASAFLRLTDVETLSADQVRSALASAAVQPGGGTAPTGLIGRAAGAVSRVAASRLGSTLLVSHLGTLEADDRLRAAAFYPVTGGGSGLSLGAATVRGTTTITLRARAAQHDDDALQRLLERVVAQLD